MATSCLHRPIGGRPGHFLSVMHCMAAARAPLAHDSQARRESQGLTQIQKKIEGLEQTVGLTHMQGLSQTQVQGLVHLGAGEHSALLGAQILF